MSMAKICMVAFTEYPFDPRPRREAEALAARGDEVDFICLSSEGYGTEAVLNGVRLHQIHIGRYRGGKSGSYLRSYFRFFLRAFRLLNTLYLQKRYDVIQIHTLPDFMVFTALLPKLLGAKVILDVHDLMPEAYISKFGKDRKSLLIRLITWVERSSVRFADRAIAVHVPHREVLVAHGNPRDKFTILLNLPDPRIFSGDIAPAVHRAGEPFRLIYHGIVTERNGLETAIRAVGAARREIPVEFDIYGGGDDLPRLRALTRELGLDGTVRFSGRFVPMEDLKHRIPEAHLGLVTLLYDPVTRHMLPTKLLEYVSIGLPTVVARTETIQAYFDDSMVRFYTPGDHEELARHIVDLYRNPDERERLVKNAGRFNAEYSWERQKQDYYRLIDSLAAE
jgi:glycosyltransferase involved in cell wall biosynthesis